MRKLVPFLLLLFGVSLTSVSQSLTQTAKLPLAISGFVENKGQVRDQYNVPNSDVKFIYADGTSFNLQLKNDGFSYTLFQAIPESGGMPESGFGSYDPEEQDYLSSNMVAHRVDVKFASANRNAELIADHKSETIFNFYTTGDVTKPVLGVSSFYQVTYKNIYPNIDLVFYAPDQDGNNQLKYDWIVRKGGNPSRIKLEYDGQNGLVYNEDGTISVISPVGSITEGKVNAYLAADASPVNCMYSLDRNTVRYRFSESVNEPVVIDPSIIWSVDYGGESNEYVSEGDLALDKKNNTYICGNTRSTLYIATVGAYQTTFGGGDYDAFLAKLQTAGKLTWATYLGGTEKDEGHAVIVDNNYNVYLAGLAHSATGIATPGTHQSVFAGNTDAFLAKFTSSGNLKWSTYYGGKGDDQINAIVCDNLGNIYFAGYTTSDTGIATPGAYQDTLHNDVFYGGDACLGEFRGDGSFIWGSYLGGASTDRAHAICLGNKKELFIQGTCESDSDFASGNVFQTTYGGGPADAYVARWDTNGKFSWCSYYGGEGDDHGRGVAVDQNNGVYIIGWTDSDSAMGTPNEINPYWYDAYATGGERLADGYLAKFNLNGQRLWGTYYGGEGRDQFKGLVIDKPNSYVYAIGLTSSEQNVSSTGAFQDSLGGSADGMLLKVNYDGTRVWGTYVGETASEKFQDIDIDNSGNVYCLMEVSGPFPLTPGTNLTTYRGATDAVVIKFNPFDQCYDPYEPNETTTSGKNILAYKDTTLYGYTAAIQSANDQDWFKIKVTPGNNLKIVLTDLVKDYNLNLYNSLGGLAKSSSNTGTQDEVIIFNSIPAGNYNLQIAHTSTEYDPNNCYRMKLMLKTSAWPTRMSDDSADSQMGSHDMFAHAELISDYFSLNVSSAFSSPAHIVMLNSFGQPVYDSEEQIETGTQTFRIPADNLAAGIYFIRVVTELNDNVLVKVAMF
ncbi:MAG: SBBP repeat-containing protein [Bacteroidetes bacterium]|nr:SBBP repeat-containing protein [Bacteroidota bacterium]